ncbi:hypothetical protein [Streptomyces ginkgonis]|uniref:hypothetical protein n=1 Tax=Streptomyces ginkgonis TaxID=1812259 RepID=UPI0021769A52|nr:hypothetical protein [Streptomyces ginkgonis]
MTTHPLDTHRAPHPATPTRPGRARRTAVRLAALAAAVTLLGGTAGQATALTAGASQDAVSAHQGGGGSSGGGGASGGWAPASAGLVGGKPIDAPQDPAPGGGGDADRLRPEPGPTAPGPGDECSREDWTRPCANGWQ